MDAILVEYPSVPICSAVSFYRFYFGAFSSKQPTNGKVVLVAGH